MRHRGRKSVTRPACAGTRRGREREGCEVVNREREGCYYNFKGETYRRMSIVPRSCLCKKSASSASLCLVPARLYSAETVRRTAQ